MRLRPALPMSVLSLLAIALLALLPSMGRLNQALLPVTVQLAQDAHHGHHAAHHSEHGQLPQPTPAPHSEHAGQDCHYCPLLAGLLGVGDTRAPLPDARLTHQPQATYRCAIVAQRHPCGLGSRGPPVVLLG